MRGKFLVFTCVIVSILFGGCLNEENKINSYEYNTQDIIEDFNNTSIVSNISELEVALKESYSITLKNDITSNNNLIMEGEFSKTDTREEHKVINMRRNLNIFYIDSSNNIISNFILKAPNLVIKSRDVTIKGGKFIGNIYVESSGFTLNDSKVDGDIYFKNEEVKQSFKLENTANVSGKIEIKEYDKG